MNTEPTKSNLRLLLRQKKELQLEHRRKRIALEDEWSLIIDASKDVHLSEGVIKQADLQGPDGSVVTTNKGTPFILLTPSAADLFAHFEKLAQTIPLKDLGWMVGAAGIGSKTTILELGGGSGGATCFLGKICQSITTVDINQDRIDLIRKNTQKFGLKNVTLLTADAITGELPQGPYDVVIIDVPTPWLLASRLPTFVRPGGYVISYSPPIISTQKMVQALEQLPGFSVLQTVELIERPWKVEGDAVRPETTKIGHSGFLTLARRLQ